MKIQPFKNKIFFKQHSITILLEFLLLSFFLGCMSKTDKLLRQIRKVKPDARDSLVEEIVKIGPPAVKPLINHLGKKDSDIRREVIKALVEIGTPAVDPLINALTNREASIRAGAAYALGIIGDKKAIPFLILLFNDDTSHVRKTAAEAVVKIGVAAIDQLVNCLLDRSNDFLVRVTSAKVLGQIADRKAVRPLMDILRNKEEFYELRVEAIEALGNIRDTQALNILIDLLNDNIVEVQCAAAKTLGKIGNRRAVLPLISLLKNRQQKVIVRDAAAEALSAIGDIRGIRAVQAYSIELAAKKVLPQEANVEVTTMKGTSTKPAFVISAHLLEGHSADDESPYIKGDYGTHEKLTRLVKFRCAKILKSIAINAKKPDAGRITIKVRHGVRQYYVDNPFAWDDVAMTIYQVSISLEKMRALNWNTISLESIMKMWSVDKNIIPDLDFRYELGPGR